MKLLLLFCLIAYAAGDSQTDPQWVTITLSKIMKTYQEKILGESFKTAKIEYEKQFKHTPPPQNDQVVPFNVYLQESKKVSDKYTGIVKSITYSSLVEAQKNLNGEYFIWDKISKSWHLPNHPAPQKPVDGAEINSRILSKKLQNKIAKSLNGGLQKRAGIFQTVADGFLSYFRSSGDDAVRLASKMDTPPKNMDLPPNNMDLPPNSRHGRDPPPNNMDLPPNSRHGRDPPPNNLDPPPNTGRNPETPSNKVDEPEPPKWNSFDGFKYQMKKFFEPAIVRYTFYIFGGLGMLFLLIDVFNKLSGNSASDQLAAAEGGPAAGYDQEGYESGYGLAGNYEYDQNGNYGYDYALNSGYGPTGNNDYGSSGYGQTGNYAYDQSGYGQTGNNGYGSSGYGQTGNYAYDQSGYGQTGNNGYGSSGYGQTGNNGYGSSGYSQNGNYK